MALRGFDSRGISSTIIAIVIVLILVGTVFVYLATNDDGVADNKIGIVVTIVPQVEMAERVGGDLVRVTLMVPVGQSPHDYAPTATQMAEVENAEFYFKVGSGVEFETANMDDILEVNSHLTVIDGSQGIEIVEMEDHGTRTDEVGLDPHIWLNPQNAIIMVSNLRDGLVSEDPDNATTYEENAATYIAELEALDSEIQDMLSPYENRSFMIQHPAWGYYSDRYGLNQLAVENLGDIPSPQELANLIDTAQEEGVKVIFVAPQFDSSSAQTIADGIDGNVVQIDSLAENYSGNLKYVSQEMKEAFELS